MVLAQSVSVSAVVKDSTSRQVLSYATIYSQKYQTGKYTGEKGDFEWKVFQDDTLIISFLSYETKRIPVNYLINTDEILLRETAYSLKTAVIKSNKKRKRNYQIGFYEDYTDFDAWGVGIGGMAINHIYNNTGETSVVKSLLVDLGKAKNQHHRAIGRVRIFAADNPKTGPGKDILKENVVFNIPKFARKIRIDLTPYQIVFPLEGLFMGIEFLGFETKEGLTGSWKGLFSKTGGRVTSTRRNDYKSVGASWRFPDTNGKLRWINLTDGSKHKDWERTLYKIGAEVESL